jgi:predicted dehydrogenase
MKKDSISPIRFGLVGTGYMGKRHAVALKAVGTVFDTKLRPICELVCSTTANGAAEKAIEFGFNRSTASWHDLVDDPAVDAIIIASPQETHREIAIAAIAANKPVFCEKPLGASLDDARAMTEAAELTGVPNMVGFNYVRTPATQLARTIILAGQIGKVVHVRAEHTEDFLCDPAAPASWRTRGFASGTMGDLSPHIINAVLRLVGPISEVVADIGTVHPVRTGERGPERVLNDDQAHLLCRFANGAMGSVTFSRIATGRKMGYAYHITGTEGAISFDQEDQNVLWLYNRHARPGRQGFTKLLTGPDHPDYKAFCLGPAHGTGYGDQIIIEARDFLKAIETRESVFPTFRDGLEVSRVIAASVRSHEQRSWISIDEI